MKFENRLVLSAMAGINDAEFCSKHKASLVIMGGFNADSRAMEAARQVVKRGRREFLFDDPVDGIEREIKRLKRTGKKFSVNVRSATLDGFLKVAEIVDEYGGIIEINAHCRQQEFIRAGCGEYLLFNSEKLFDIVKSVSRVALTSVKIRGGHRIDYGVLCKKLVENGCRIIHVDAMIPGSGCDLNLISRVSDTGFTIGNNSFVDAKSGEDIIEAGAKMVSAARAVLKNPNFFEDMLKSRILSQPVELSDS
jgi:TIM-barrel protein